MATHFLPLRYGQPDCQTFQRGHQFFNDSFTVVKQQRHYLNSMDNQIVEPKLTITPWKFSISFRVSKRFSSLHFNHSASLAFTSIASAVSTFTSSSFIRYIHNLHVVIHWVLTYSASTVLSHYSMPQHASGDDHNLLYFSIENQRTVLTGSVNLSSFHLCSERQKCVERLSYERNPTVFSCVVLRVKKQIFQTL